MKSAKYLFPLLSVVLFSACGGSDNDDLGAALPAAAAPSSAGAASSAPGASPTIDKVAGASGFNALLAAATKAELGAALADSNARLTVFAPTDAAFNQLAASLGFANATAMVDALPPAALKSILTYHVLPASRAASELRATPQSAQPTLYSFEGQPAAVTLNSSQSSVTLTDAALTTANVTAPDVAASNGVIHAIDKVLVPPGVLNIVQMAQVNPQLSSLVGAVTGANLQASLSAPGAFTVFAPTNSAFAAAPAGLTPQQLKTVLTYHALGTQVLASQIPFGAPVNTLASQSIVINAGTPPTISDTSATPARIVATNVRASNGVIHVIDKVLIPAL
ncbi:MAG TPA: fasciclin domain-containing protein [Noviherbaspirillum sp.]|uniref:fasciclin domain-containing protein n=1 Tax=Noviherbaspirillum sp. TaxID=1926288 RepID=UPI002D248552|nr:fasciclin domain-containing protein [Noviherbaspirillum sp.]HYD97233.1 fasciclin domain-containing protein [Noviherbaspirillum sp.]